MGIEAAVIAAAVIGAGASIASGISSSKQAKKAAKQQAENIKSQPMPEPPKVDIAGEEKKAAQQAQAQVTQRRKAVARNRTIFTSPLGIGGQAETIKKKLLGQ